MIIDDSNVTHLMDMDEIEAGEMLSWGGEYYIKVYSESNSHNRICNLKNGRIDCLPKLQRISVRVYPKVKLVIGE